MPPPKKTTQSRDDSAPSRRSRSKKAKQAKKVKKAAPSKKDAAEPSVDAAVSMKRSASDFPIVGIGASAGGLEACEAFFKAMPSDSGMAFVLVVHLDPSHVSILPELLQRHTQMPVKQAQDGVQVQPDHVYVIPPNRDLAILNGILVLREITHPRGVNLPIDSFFRSLAKDQGAKAVCVILSGTGTDGTLGVKAVKAELGMVMVQDEQSAKYGGMPRSALATGLADYVLPPGEMPEALIQYAQAAHKGTPRIVPTRQGMPEALQKIFVLLRAHTNHDFSLYKHNTICRRIERRMNVHQISDISDYVRYLQTSDSEADILFKELLIGVTNFFRDPVAFDRLKDEVIPNLLRDKPDDYTVRAWVPGCSTGEEAYSLAIVLQECMEALGRHFSVQIFGTDLDEDVVNVARTGLYPTSISADVSPGRLKRFFSQEDAHYRIKKSIRETLVFAPQNVIKDPPFTKLDLLCCRNLLIYLGGELQQKLLPLFYYSLRPDGILFLGTSETIGQATDLFETLDKKWKLFRRKPSTAALGVRLDFPPVAPTTDDTRETTASVIPSEEVSRLKLIEVILRESGAPPCAIVDEKHNVVYIHGRTGRYLEPAQGEASVNIVDMARPGLRAELRSLIRQVSRSRQAVARRGLQVQTNGDTASVDLIVKPVQDLSAERGLMMVMFAEPSFPAPAPDSGIMNPAAKGADRSVEEVEEELRYTRETLQTTIEELETSNEELKSTNEELQSTNEELQSTNEELETSKEELQSLNEESATVNVELQSRIDELARTNDDMKNLLDSTDIATIFLDQDLCVRRFTPRATDIVPLTIADMGRPVRHFVSNLEDVNFAESAEDVLKDLATREEEVRDKDDRHYIMRMRPYRTVNNAIEGVVITFNDVTGIRRLKGAQEIAQGYAQAIVETIREPLIVLDKDLVVQSANRAFYNAFDVTPQDTEHRGIYDLGNGQWNIPRLRELLEHILPNNTSFDDFEVSHDFERIGRKTMLLNARRISRESGGAELILLAIEDVTNR